MSSRNLTRPTIFAGVLAATGVLLMSPAPAQADPAHRHDMQMMCAQLDINPTTSGVAGVAASWMAQYGNTPAAARLGADTLIDAVTYLCPEYQGIVAAWSNSGKRGSTV